MATTLIVYWLKANAVLLGFVAAYYLGLRRLTFFTLNRFYLLGALLAAAVYPALPVPALLPAPAEPLIITAAAAVPTAGAALTTPAAAAGPDWALCLVGAYALGAGVLLLRLGGQLLALWRLHRRSRPARVQGQRVRVLPTLASPFSFGRHIYLSPAQHAGPELAAVLRHEQVHVRQGHTLDTLLAEMTVVLAWCNPAAWLLRRAILDNLEYLADAAVLQTGAVDRRSYQYSLLHLSQGVATAPILVSHFAFSTLKNRVVMMNAPISPRRQLLRYLLAGPVLFSAALGVAGARAQAPTVLITAPAAPVAAVAAPAVAPEGAAAPATAVPRPEPRKRPAKPASPARSAPAVAAPAPPPVYFIDGQRATEGIAHLTPADIASISVLKGAKAQALLGHPAAGGAILITTKAHEQDAPVREFNSRYSGVAAAPATPTTAPAAAPAQAPTAAPMPYLAPNALVYITQHYPGARLLEVSDAKAADGSLQHRALVAVGRRPAYLIFDDKGEFIAEQLVGPSAVPAAGK